jgi:hypothetical protein
LAADEPVMAGKPAALNDEKGLEAGGWKRDCENGRGKQVDVRNGEEAIPADDEPDPAQGSRTLN